MSTNDITGDALRSRASTKAYDEGWDRIFSSLNKTNELAKQQAEALKEEKEDKDAV